MSFNEDREKEVRTEPVAEEAAKEPEQNPESKKRGLIREYLPTILFALGVGLFLHFFILVNAVIPSGSMENTIMTGDRLFGNRLAYRFGDPERYDIVIFRYPDNEKTLYIKRVIGLPGETVVISGGKVFIVPAGIDTTDIPDESLLENPKQIDGTLLLDDSFCPEEPIGGKGRDGVFRVPEDHYFMLGDNRNHSKDSRFWKNKYVARNKILGKALVKYWPLNEIEFF